MEGLDPSQRKKLDPFYNAAGRGSSSVHQQNPSGPVYTMSLANPSQGGAPSRSSSSYSVKDRINRMYNRMMRGGGGSGGGNGVSTWVTFEFGGLFF